MSARAHRSPRGVLPTVRSRRGIVPITAMRLCRCRETAIVLERGVTRAPIRVGLRVRSATIPRWVANLATALDGDPRWVLTIFDDASGTESVHADAIVIRLYRRFDAAIFGRPQDPSRFVAARRALRGIAAQEPVNAKSSTADVDVLLEVGSAARSP